MLQRPQASKLFAAALLAPMAVLPAAPAVAAGAGTEATADHQATELAQLRFPRLRMPSVPRMPRVFAITPCLLYTSPSPRDATLSRMPSSA